MSSYKMPGSIGQPPVSIPTRRKCGICDETGQKEMYTYDFNYLGKFLSISLRGVLEYCKCEVGRELADKWKAEICPDCENGIIKVEKTREAEWPYSNTYIDISFCRVCAAGQKVNQHIDEVILVEKEKIIADWKKRSGLAPLQLKQTFDNYICKEGGPGEKAIVLLKTGAKEKKSLLLIGNTGVGKSHLAAAYLNFSFTLGNFGLFVSLTELMSALRKTISNKSGDDEALSWDQLLEKYVNAPLLVLDDMGQEKPSEKVNEVLFNLLNTRINWERPTIVTTNYGKEVLLESGYTPAIVSRLASFEVVRLSGEDYRVKNRGNLKVVDPWK